MIQVTVARRMSPTDVVKHPPKNCPTIDRYTRATFELISFIGCDSQFSVRVGQKM